jgi:general secretion pathway protein C
MWFKIKQLVKGWLGRITNISSLSVIALTLLRTFLIFLAVTLLSYEAISFFYKIISFPLAGQTDRVGSNVTVPAVTEDKKTGSVADYGIIVERNLFHSTLKAIKDNELDGGFSTSEENFTDFDLKGTVVCNSSFGFIFIEKRNSKKQKFYRLGDMIGSNKLIKITRNMATFLSDGREIILMVKPTSEDQPRPDSPYRNLTLDRKTVNKNLGNLNALMKGAVMRPFMHKGMQEGFIVSKIVPSSLYKRIGLQNGDILIDINDKKINAATLMQAVNLVKSGSRITLNIKRKGRPQTINYTFE